MGQRHDGRPRRRFQNAGAALLERLIAAGTSSYPRETRRRLRVLNVVTYLIAVFTLIYAVQQILFLDLRTFAPVIAINFALIIVALVVPLAHRFHETAGALFLAGSEYAALFAFTAYLGQDSGLHLQYFVGAAAPFVILGLGRLRLVIFAVLLALILHLAAWHFFGGREPLLPVDQETLNMLYVNAVFTTVGLIAASVYYAYLLADRAQAEVDALLRNILPEDVVERLKDHPGATISDSFKQASVLFADIVGFTPLSKELGAARTVQVLNRFFTVLDLIAKEEGVEKIKTIGDAYMVASGIPVPDPDHCARLARMAIRIRQTVQQTATAEGIELDVRIGMATGPVMAGVIGAHKFSYDVWGDTVNAASRMESYSEPGFIHVTPMVQKQLRDRFNFTGCGVKQIKGLGRVETWYLIDEKDLSEPGSD